MIEFLRVRGAFLFLMLSAVVVGGIPVLLSFTSPQLNNSVVIAVCAFYLFPMVWLVMSGRSSPRARRMMASMSR